MGVSGGADSTALLRLMCALKRKRGGLSIFVVHVNHHLRDSARADACAVEALCEACHIPCTVADVRVIQGGSPEDAARAARYAAFRAAYDACGADALVLAHNRDDCAETVLMHLAYGAGTAGLCGIRSDTHVKGMRVLRPLLSSSRAEIEAYLSFLHQRWRTDETNADRRYTRNFLRHDVLPLLATRFEGVVAACARTAEVLGAEEDYLSGVTDAWLRDNAKATPCRFFKRAPFSALPLALKRRVVRAFFGFLGELGFEKTEEIVAQISLPGALVNLPGGAQMLVTGEYVHALYEAPAPVLPEMAEFFSIAPYESQPLDGKRTQCISRSLLARAKLRFMRAGDVIVPFGMTGTKKLSRFLMDKKVDRPFRAHLPLLCAGDEVLMVPGVGASNLLKASDEPMMCLTVSQPLPWEIAAAQK